MYHQSGSEYLIYFGKSSSQELHRWYNGYNYTKWQYTKDNNSDWWEWFYNAFHKSPPAGEKIVYWYLCWITDATSQMLAFGRYNVI